MSPCNGLSLCFCSFFVHSQQREGEARPKKEKGVLDIDDTAPSAINSRPKFVSVFT